ncbi:MAG TPA: hypothetical protein PKG54_03070 [Phycisphaerae bacterium]|nr:hypothetical protein [Phycisphaerae bacterium]HOB73485.1 hypothetical protein [Phycisphaerae bacterium]HOJ54093.1 hypothetical protein [Phycisphaerae bacterium]HOL25614.1 hypothetical protein [Phycisphaerae bacterium]HPP22749.1 hypothetical protein [Phycisphaerae bacterium]
MSVRIMRMAIMTSLALVPWLAQAQAQQRPVLKASKILKPHALRGDGYHVEENVEVVDNRYSFVLVTPQGRIDAQGINMLELRISEVEAIKRAERMIKESPELAGVKDNIKKTGQGLKALVTNPVDAIGEAAKGAGRKAKALTKKETYTKGGSDSRRELAVILGCDPETRNPVLKKQLDQISLRRSAGKGLMAVATFGLTGGAALAAKGASAMRTTAEMQEALRTTPLYKINENTQAELVRLGVDPATSKSFVEHPQFTTLQRLQFLAQLKRFTSTRGLPRLVHLALRTRSETETLGLIHALELLADLARQHRIAEIVDTGRPAVRLTDGRIVVVSDADYLLNGPELTSILSAIAREKFNQSGPAVLLIIGQASPEAREALTAAEIQVVENGRVEQVK